MTTKMYQSPLTVATVIAEEERVKAELWSNLETSLIEGFWYCQDHGGKCERIEGEQGQPAHCSVCGGVHLDYNKPAWKRSAV